MKKFLVIISCASIVSFVLSEDVPRADYVEGEQSTSLITPELSAAAVQIVGSEAAQQLMHAVRLNMAVYDRDMKSKSGRERWHGRLVGEHIDDVNLVKVETYSNEVDGVVWRYQLPFKPATSNAIKRDPEKYTNGVLKTLWERFSPARKAVVAERWAARHSTNTVITTTVVE